MDKEIERQTQGSPVRFMHDKAGQLTSHWVMEYTPEEVGTLELTVLTRDDAGNETRTTQNVEVATPPVEQYTDARPLTLGVQSDTGRLSPDNRYDWYSIDMVEGQAYTVDMVSMGVYADSFDTLMALYDTDGTSALVSDDDSGDEDNSRIAFTAPSTGTYYLQATSRGHARNGALPTGSYHVLVTRNEQAPDPEACPTSVPTDGQYRRFTLNAGAECWIQVDASAHNFADTSLYFTTNNPGNYYPDFKSRVMAELHLGSKEGTLVPLDEGLEHSAYRLPASPTYWVRVWNVSEAAMPMGIVSGPMFWLN